MVTATVALDTAQRHDSEFEVPLYFFYLIHTKSVNISRSSPVM